MPRLRPGQAGGETHWPPPRLNGLPWWKWACVEMRDDGHDWTTCRLCRRKRINKAEEMGLRQPPPARVDGEGNRIPLDHYDPDMRREGADPMIERDETDPLETEIRERQQPRGR